MAFDKKLARSTKIIREYGIKDLKRYQKKIKGNIKIFEQAILKERKELKHVQAMIDNLKADLKELKKL